jgi:cell division septum initiation protein DivIVA
MDDTTQQDTLAQVDQALCDVEKAADVFRAENEQFREIVEAQERELQSLRATRSSLVDAVAIAAIDLRIELCGEIVDIASACIAARHAHMATAVEQERWL